MRVPSSDARRLLADQIAKYQAQADGVSRYLTDRGISLEAVDRFQLGYTGEHANRQYANRLAIPYLSPAGPWLVKFRCIEDHDCKAVKCPKYTQEAGVEAHLFNASVLLDAERVVVCEGEMDAIAVSMAGLPAVGYPGTHAWGANKHWRWLFESVDDVVVVADGDEPKEGESRGVGEQAAARVLDSLRSAIAGDVRVVVMPVGYDANKFIAEYGDIEFMDRIGWL